MIKHKYWMILHNLSRPSIQSLYDIHVLFNHFTNFYNSFKLFIFPILFLIYVCLIIIFIFFGIIYDVTVLLLLNIGVLTMNADYLWLLVDMLLEELYWKIIYLIGEYLSRDMTKFK